MWKIEPLGLIEYDEAYRYQERLVKMKQQGDKDNFFLLLEHPLVFTRGKGAKLENILDKNIPVQILSRGGDLTCHEPGQLVGYIILDLKKEGITARAFINKIEDLIINSLKKLGVSASKNPDYIGVWAGDKKIASIGIGIRKGITMHGFALNVCNNLEGFRKINPCGLKPETYTSLKNLTGKDISVEEVRGLIIEEFKNSF